MGIEYKVKCMYSITTRYQLVHYIVLKNILIVYKFSSIREVNYGLKKTVTLMHDKTILSQTKQYKIYFYNHQFVVNIRFLTSFFFFFYKKIKLCYIRMEIRCRVSREREREPLRQLPDRFAWHTTIEPLSQDPHGTSYTYTTIYLPLSLLHSPTTRIRISHTWHLSKPRRSLSLSNILRNTFV